MTKKNNQLDAVKLGEDAYRSCAKLGNWAWDKEVRLELIAEGQRAAHETHLPFIGRYGPRGRHTRTEIARKMINAAQYAMRKLVDSGAVYMLGGGAGSNRGDDDKSRPLPGVADREVDQPGTAKRDAIQQSGITVAENPGNRPISAARAKREIELEYGEDAADAANIEALRIAVALDREHDSSAYASPRRADEKIAELMRTIADKSTPPKKREWSKKFVESLLEPGTRQQIMKVTRRFTR